MRVSSFGARLRRARLPRVILVYLAASWLVLQVSALLRVELGLPVWITPAVIVLLLAGLVVVIATSLVQANPSVAARARREELPDSWEVDLGDVREAVTHGRFPHLTWGRALLAGVLSFAILGLIVWLSHTRSGGGDRGATGAGVPLPRPAAAPADAPAEGHTVAVLPFVNMSADPENTYFADGITEDVITELSKIGSLRVISRTSVMRYRDTPKGLREIGGELGASAVLEGSVRRAGDRVRIVAQLIDVRTDDHLWAATYDRDLADIFGVQGEIAQRIAAALRTELSPSENRRLTQAPTADPAAYDLYLRGRQALHRFTREDNEQAVALFEQAVARDSTFAAARAVLSEAYTWRTYVYDFPDEWLDRALEQAQAAIDLQPELAAAHAALAFALEPRGRFGEALASYRRAVDLNPSYAQGVIGMAFVLTETGRPDEALPWAARAVELDPFLSDNRWLVGIAYAAVDLFEPAEKAFLEALELQPDHPYAREWLALLYQTAGDDAKAAQVIEDELRQGTLTSGLVVAGHVALQRRDWDAAERYFRRVPPGPQRRSADTELGCLALLTGRREEGSRLLRTRRQVLEGFLAASDEDRDQALEMVLIHALSGRTDEAFVALDRWAADGGLDTGGLRRSPCVDALRSDERFERVLAGVDARKAEMRRRIEAWSRTSSSVERVRGPG